MKVARLVVCLVTCLIISAQVTNLFGQDVSTLVVDVSDLADGSVAQARLEAQRQTASGGLPFRSFRRGEYRRFSGEYTPPELPEDKRGQFAYGLALFSDDGCSVAIKGSQIHGLLGRPQHLPNSSESFHVLPVALVPGESVDITVDYLNTIYFVDPRRPGLPDIDGCTLFLYLIPVSVTVDANRDGAITLSGESRDITSEAQPFRFWVNSDDDRGAQGAEQVPVANPDNNDDQLSSVRDLEDLTRLWLNIDAFHDKISNGTFKIGLKWKNTNGTSPVIKIYKSADAQGSDAYLKDDRAGQDQFAAEYRGAIATVAGNNAVVFPADLWTGYSEQNPKRCLIFEGIAEGKGQLCITIHKSDGTEIAEGGGAWLDLVDVQKMYLRVRATGIDESFPEPSQTSDRNPPEPMMGWETDPNGKAYDEGMPLSWQETKQYIVFVHGWNMSYEGSQNFAETMFKRLWQRGYKGRFAYMRWPTMDNSFANIPYTYNASEYRAWKCGESLRQFMNTLPSGYSRNLVSHSMGGIVCGSALQKGMNVDNYALLNAAVPAACYDDSPTLDQGWDYTTPHYDSDEDTRNLSYRYKLNSINGTLINFYLSGDDALEAWEVNNYTSGPFSLGTRPQRYNAGATGYYYNPNASTGQRLGINYPALVGRFITSPHEAMSYVAQSPTKAVGADGRTAGSIDDKVDMAMYGFGGMHSAQFRFALQQTVSFYNELLTKFDITFLP